MKANGVNRTGGLRLGSWTAKIPGPLPTKSVAVIFSFLLLATLTGCIGIPIPSSGKEVLAGKRICNEDLMFAHRGDTTLSEFTARFGKPWNYFDDIRVATFYWETKWGQWTWRIGRDAEYPGGLSDITRLHYLFVAFDADGRLDRWIIVDHPKNKPAHELAESWLCGK